ncbi:NUDIX hydrolase [Micromonospora sp. NPDC049559]|uniref:NUDIX hydrolase n=1 Tax=Micromonospora sp. NPDC049559 TaxID=3155923 RepID=UPI003420A41E
MSDTYGYYAGQARLVGAAGLIIRNATNSLLLLKPSYKSVWHVPGGIMEPDESPRAAARREALEEIGLEVVVGRLLSVDYKSANTARPSGIQFLFDGGILPDHQLSQIRPDATEVQEWGFFPIDEAVALVEPGGPAARLANTLGAFHSSHPIYLEDGELIEARTQ